MALALTALAIVFATGADSGAGSAVAILGLMLYVGAFAVSLGPIFWLLNGEIYPLGVRSKAAAVGTMANWLFNFIVSLTFLLLDRRDRPRRRVLLLRGDLRGDVRLLPHAGAGDEGQDSGGDSGGVSVPGREAPARRGRRRDCIAADDAAARVERLQGAGGPPRRARAAAPARALRRRPGSRHAADRRGGRPLPRLLEEPGHRRDARAARRARRRSAASPSVARRCSAASTSTSPRTGPCCTSRCGCRGSARWWSTASTS